MFICYLQIQSKINELREKKGLLEADWEEHWDVLNITLEVMHFARDAQLAEEWIVKEDLNLYGKDKGVRAARFVFILKGR